MVRGMRTSMKHPPRRTRKSPTKPAIQFPIDREFPPKPESLAFDFHIENKTSRDSKETKKRGQKKVKGPRKTR